jgi:hypothetical protein
VRFLYQEDKAMDIFVLLDLKIVTLLCIYIATFCGVNSYLYQLVSKWSSNFFLLTIGLLLSLTLIDILTENILKVKLSVVYFDNILILFYLTIIVLKIKMNLSEWRNYIEGAMGC